MKRGQPLDHRADHHHVMRSGRTSRAQALLEGKLEAAGEVQQVLLPEQIDSIRVFAIESVYEPAQQVGCDFFQVVPTAEGGLLLVIGDVAGKGLTAAMLVSVMVGAIRATAEFTHAPQEILASGGDRGGGEELWAVGRYHRGGD